MLEFKIKNSEEKARTGELTLNKNVINTPCFMPVGTAATIKAMSTSEVSNLGYNIILANTLQWCMYTFYHLIIVIQINTYMIFQ